MSSFIANTYGKVIISESFLPEEEMSIKPTNNMGLHGGRKYFVQGNF